MFPGQGGQYFQMGKELYQGHPVFKAGMEQIDMTGEAVSST